MNDGYPSQTPASQAALLLRLTGAATLAAGALLYGAGTSQMATLAPGAAGAILQANGAAAPSWTTAPTLTGLTVNGVVDVVHATAGNNSALLRNAHVNGYGVVFRGGGGSAGLYHSAWQSYDGTLRMFLDGVGALIIGTDPGGSELLRVGGSVRTSGGVGVGGSPLTGGGAASWVTCEGSAYSGGLICSVSGVAKALTYFESGYYLHQAAAGVGIILRVNQTIDALTISSAGNIALSGSLTAGARLALTPSNFGYGSTYKAVILGSTGAVETVSASTIAFGVDPASVAGGSFTGNGTELLFRRSMLLLQPNAAGTDWERASIRLGTLTLTGKITSASPVPASFADLAAVRTWLAANFT
jgi:hypothetical protein